MLLVLVPLALAAPGSHANDPDAGNMDPHLEDVRLEFGWKPGMGCDVTWRASRTGLGEGRDGLRAGTSTLRVEPHEEGLLVRHLPADGEPVKERDPYAGLLDEVAQGVPDFVVALDGSYRKVQDIAAWRVQVRGAVAPLAQTLEGDARARYDALTERLTTGPTLATQVRRYWDKDVGLWLGQKLPAGSSAMAVVDAPSALMPDVSLSWMSSLRLVKWVRCEEQDPTESCVLLEESSRARESDLRTAVTAYTQAFAGFGVDVGTPQVKAVSLTRKVSFVAEPETLVPHRYEEESRLHVEVEANGLRTWDLVETRQELTRCGG